jgi:Zn-dependent peptidase ImmA (M78 family)
MKYKKSRPKILRVMGRNYKVTFEKEATFKSAAAGLCDNQKMTITIMEDQHPAEELDTVIHELLHAIWHHMSMGEHPPEEEILVRKSAGGLTAVILDNQQFGNYISAIYKHIRKMK